jgi:site-specific DNA-methyltransferase (adenine-specific)/site-specific DNA-methyltransferase (cytosine-N4-specific)
MKTNNLELNTVHYGDSFELIKDLPDNSVDLIVTSPPYADTVSYGKSINVLSPENYPSWIMPLMNEAYRVLKPSGSFILNINDKLHKKQRSIYVMKTIVRVVEETQLQLYDRYFWTKKSGLPTGGDKRLNDRVEYIFHFVKDVDNFKCFSDRIRKPYAPASMTRFKTGCSGNKIVDENGIGRLNVKKKEPNPKGTIPTNVFEFNTGSALRFDKKYTGLHPAPYHPDLPKFFVNWLTDEQDVVLDPFMGSGTTAVVCKDMNRQWIGFELNENYKSFIDARLDGSLEEETDETI